MEEKSMKPCEEFEITIHNVSLNFEFFTKEYIHEELAKIIDEDLVKEFTIPEEKPFAEIRAFYSSKKDLISGSSGIVVGEKSL